VGEKNRQAAYLAKKLTTFFFSKPIVSQKSQLRLEVGYNLEGTERVTRFKAKEERTSEEKGVKKTRREIRGGARGRGEEGEHKSGELEPRGGGKGQERTKESKRKNDKDANSQPSMKTEEAEEKRGNHPSWEEERVVRKKSRMV